MRAQTRSCSMKALNLFSLSLQLTDCSVQFDLVLLSHIYGIFDFCKSCEKATPPFTKIPKSSKSPRSETDGIAPSGSIVMVALACLAEISMF